MGWTISVLGVLLLALAFALASSLGVHGGQIAVGSVGLILLLFGLWSCRTKD